MYRIHKLCRSISHRPRHLFDLPDEILCLILEYCCQDLDFLLWSCPLVTLENQFCHDCFHCTLCHGRVPRPRSRPRLQRHSSSNSQRGLFGASISSSTASALASETLPNTAAVVTPILREAQGGHVPDQLSRTSSNNNKSCKSSANSKSDSSVAPILKKRRKRCHDKTACSTINDVGVNRYMTCLKHGTQGSSPCPRNGNRPWCHHLQQQNSARIPFLWRLFPQSLAHTDFISRLPIQSIFSDTWTRSLSRPYDHLTHVGSSIMSIQPSAKSILNSLVHRFGGTISDQLYSENFANSGLLPSNLHNPRSMPTATTNGISSSTSSAFQDFAVSARRSTGSNPVYRRRTLSMGASSSNSSGASMSRSWSLTEAIHSANFWRRDEKLKQSDLAFDDFESSTENDEMRDDFDSSVHLALPFQLLLVSSRFADAAVQSLWRNLVFHGQDTYQMQSLLSTLSMDDGTPLVSLDNAPGCGMSGLEKLGEANEEEDEDGEVKEYRLMGRASDTSRSRHAVEDMKTGTAAKFNVYPPKYGSSEHPSPPPLRINENHETSMSWFDSWNNSLKQFSRFQGVAGVYGSNTETLTTPTAASTATAAGSSYIKGQRRHTSAGSGPKYRNGYPWLSSTGNERSRPNQSGPPVVKLDKPRWSYRAHVRRVVLNFSHPQASPQMFRKVLECLRARCPDQIVALDLHANEKMRDSGLDNGEELERHFGSGFSRLRYLRLQGGFVDNQLLCALIKGLGSPERAPTEKSSVDYTGYHYPPAGSQRSTSMHSIYSAPSCRLSQVFLGPGSVTDSAVEKLIVAAGHCLEVFTVTSCVDVGGGALASLLTKCPKLRVLGVHRSLARDKDLLEGLGIEVDNATGNTHQVNEQPVTGNVENTNAGNSPPSQSARVRKAIVAPLQRLELGTVKLTRVGITEILKGTCETLRFLVLETQHFSEELLTDVITPFCSKLEGLYFDDPEYIQKQQQQMQGLGFSAGRRGAHLPNRHFEFGRSKRTFYSDPNRLYQYVPQQPSGQRHQQNQFPRSETKERRGAKRPSQAPKISAWLGETSTDEWVTYGDCALWTSAASPGISYENGGADAGNQRFNSQHIRRQPLPLFNAYHSDTFMRSLTQSSSRAGGTASAGFYAINNNLFVNEYEDVLVRLQVTRAAIENVIQTLRTLTAFTVMQVDFIEESQGQSELKMMMREDEAWVQSAGFRALQLFYLFLFLSMIYFGTLRW